MTYSRLLALLGCLSLAACASGVKGVEIPAGSDPQAKLQEADAELQTARAKQYDQLSPGRYGDAQDALADARKDIEKGKPAENTLKDISKAMANTRQVNANGEKYAESLAPVLKARQAALDAKADSVMTSELRDADKDLKSIGKDIEGSGYQLDAKDTSKLENKYAAVELGAVKINNLGQAHALIERADNAGASGKTPRTFEEAKSKYNGALRAIEANRRSPEAYKPAVDQATQAAVKLDQVLALTKDKQTSETAALEIYSQRQQLASTQDQLTREQSQSAATAATLNQIKGQNQAYAGKAALQARIEEIKSEFAPNEAEVLKDSNRLIVRLKSMKFSSARAEINPDSLATLAKVKELIAAVPSEKIVVEGHTDSVGGPAMNKKLSQKRADSIKQYLVSDDAATADKIVAEGFGYEKPLTTNKTAAGRATNRRVDVVIETKDVL